MAENRPQSAPPERRGLGLHRVGDSMLSRGTRASNPGMSTPSASIGDGMARSNAQSVQVISKQPVNIGSGSNKSPTIKLDKANLDVTSKSHNQLKNATREATREGTKQGLMDGARDPKIKRIFNTQLAATVAAPIAAASIGFAAKYALTFIPFSFKKQTDEVEESVGRIGALTEKFKSFVGDATNFIIPIGGFIAYKAAEFENEFQKVAKTLGGFDTAASGMVAEATLNVAVQGGIDVEEATPMMGVFAQHHKSMQLSIDDYRSLGMVSSEFMHVLGMSNEEAAELIATFKLLGVGTGAIKNIGAAAYGMGRELGFSSEVISDIIAKSNDLVFILGNTVDEAGLTKTSKSITEVAAAYRDLSAASGAASVEWATEFLTKINRASDEAETLAQSTMNYIRGTTFALSKGLTSADDFFGADSLTQFEAVAAAQNKIVTSSLGLQSNMGNLKDFVEGSRNNRSLRHGEQIAKQRGLETGIFSSDSQAEWVISNARKTLTDMAKKENLIGPDGKLIDTQALARMSELWPKAMAKASESSKHLIAWDDSVAAARSSMEALTSRLQEAGQAMLISIGRPILWIGRAVLGVANQFVDWIDYLLTNIPGLKFLITTVAGTLIGLSAVLTAMVKIAAFKQFAGIIAGFTRGVGTAGTAVTGLFKTLIPAGGIISRAFDTTKK